MILENCGLTWWCRRTLSGKLEIRKPPKSYYLAICRDVNGSRLQLLNEHLAAASTKFTNVCVFEHHITEMICEISQRVAEHSPSPRAVVRSHSFWLTIDAASIEWQSVELPANNITPTITSPCSRETTVLLPPTHRTIAAFAERSVAHHSVKMREERLLKLRI